MSVTILAERRDAARKQMEVAHAMLCQDRRNPRLMIRCIRAVRRCERISNEIRLALEGRAA